MGNARIGFKKYKGFRKALSKNEAQTCTECMARGCTGGTHARRRALIERELVNIMTAIKAGILTSTTKAELEKLEAERDRLLQNGLGQQTKADTVATILPNAIGRSKAMLDDLIKVTQHQVDKARGILRELMESEIVLHSTSDGSSGT